MVSRFDRSKPVLSGSVMITVNRILHVSCIVYSTDKKTSCTYIPYLISLENRVRILRQNDLDLMPSSEIPTTFLDFDHRHFIKS